MSIELCWIELGIHMFQVGIELDRKIELRECFSKNGTVFGGFVRSSKIGQNMLKWNPKSSLSYCTDINKYNEGIHVYRVY